MSHGANVVALEPPELREAVVRRLRSVLAAAAEAPDATSADAIDVGAGNRSEHRTREGAR